MAELPERQRRILKLFSCLSISLNSLSAGSIFVFPLYGPSIARSLSLGSSQTNAVAVGAIVAEYLSSPFWGALTDKSGPRLVSASAGVLFAGGYGLMARALRDQAHGTLSGPWQQLPAYAQPPDWAILVLFYALAGSATSGSYFSAVATAAKSFPQHAGLAVALPCAMFGLSPLLLSWVASTWFSVEYSDDLNVVGFLTFLAVVLFAINLLGAALLRVLPEQVEPGEPDETTALLPTVVKPDAPQTVRDLLSDPAFWALGACLLLVTGPAEMVQASLGSIIEALVRAPVTQTMAVPPLSALRLRSRHVQVISACNTVTRVIAGALSDWIAPTPGRPDKGWSVSRLYMVSATSFGFALACLYVATDLKQAGGAGLWVLSISTGIAYGLVFTLTPAVVALVWPIESFGRNWGALSYWTALGSVIFSGLYGVVADGQTRPDQAVCIGSKCFSATFWICAVGALLASGLALVLRRRRNWRGRV